MSEDEAEGGKLGPGDLTGSSAPTLSQAGENTAISHPIYTVIELNIVINTTVSTVVRHLILI